jgi:hypothetical protein
MDEDWEIEGTLRRLYGRVDSSGVWAGVRARAGEGGARRWLFDRLGTWPVKRRRTGRLRVALYTALAVVLLGGVAVGTVFAVKHFGQQPSVLVIDDGTGNGVGMQPAAGGAQGDSSPQTTQPEVSYPQAEGWARLPLTGEGGWVQQLVIDPSDPAVVYAATGEGLFKTADGAESWHEILSVGGEVAVDPVSPSTVYVVWPDAASPRILRSDDGGESWTELDSAILLDSPNQSNYVFDGGGFGPPVTGGGFEASTIYLATDSGVWRSVDRGESWSEVTREEQTRETLAWWGVASSPAQYGTTVRDAETGSSAGVEVAVADSDDGSIVYAGTMGGVYKSVDGGATWKLANAGLTSSQVYGLFPDPVSPTVLYAATDSGIQKSSDGGASWDVVLAGGYYFAGEFVAGPNGTGSQSGGVSSMVIAPSSPSTLYAWNGDGVSRSDDGGATWNHRAAEGLLTVDSQPTGYTGRLVLVDAGDPDIVFAEAEGQLLRSVDAGDTWAAVPGIWGVGLLVDPNHPSVMYVSGWVERPQRLAEAPHASLFKSVDAGVTWTAILNDEAAGIWAKTLDSHDPAYIYLLELDDTTDTLHALVRSSDGGATWENVDFSTLGNHYDQLLFDPQSPDTMYAKTVDHATEVLSMDICRSTDGGATWQSIVDEAVADDINLYLVMGPKDGTLYGFSSAGLFRWAPGDDE